jgi:preprotein translocase subunit SecG
MPTTIIALGISSGGLPLGALLDVFSGIVMTLFTICALLLTIVILLQEGKGGGLAGAFGGAGADAFGVKAGSVNKFTAWLGAAFLGLALLHAGMQQAGSPNSSEDIDVNVDKYSESVEPGADADGAATDDSDAPGPDAPGPDAPEDGDD